MTIVVHNSGLVIYESENGIAEQAGSVLEEVFGSLPQNITVGDVCYTCYFFDLCPEFVVLAAGTKMNTES